MSILAGWSSSAGWSGMAGWSAGAGWSGSGALAGWASTPGSDPVLSEALILSRAALVGPFREDQQISVPWPQPIDEPERLAWWDTAPRLQVCELEAVAGLSFTASRNDTLSLAFAGTRSQRIVKLIRPTEEIFEQQLSLVANYAELRGDRRSEVLTQTTPQVDFWGSIVGLQPYRNKWTLELVGICLSLASHVEMRFKHAFACPRPVVRSPQIQPMIPTPGHSSWPSGHATEAYAVATLLQALLPQGQKYREQLNRQAARIAVNRTVAGLHYPVDSAAARLLGTALAEFLIARCTGQEWHERGFNGPRFRKAREDAPLDFDPRVSMTDNTSNYYEYTDAPSTVPPSPLLEFMWKKAAAEWRTAR